MRVRFCPDPVSGNPKIYEHSVTEAEVEQVFGNRGIDYGGRGGTRIRVGPTDGGRVLRVVFVPEDGGAFVITAYQPGEQAQRAFRRRMRRES